MFTALVYNIGNKRPMYSSMNNIKKIRLARGITQSQLAEMAGTSNVTIQRLEAGTRQINDKWLTRISESLECSKIDLISEDNQDLGIDNKMLVDKVLFKEVMEALEIFWKDNSITPDIDHKIKAIFFVYEETEKSRRETNEYKALLRPSMLSLLEEKIH